MLVHDLTFSLVSSLQVLIISLELLLNRDHLTVWVSASEEYKVVSVLLQEVDRLERMDHLVDAFAVHNWSLGVRPKRQHEESLLA